MKKQPMRGIAMAVLCLALTASAGMAQQYPQTRTYTAPSSYQSAATIVGTYNSDDFHPSPLVLTITGMDAAGNLSGQMSGMRTLPNDVNMDPSWERWQQVFGQKGVRATYQGGRVLVQFPNGAYYDLQLKGNTMTGTYAESANFTKQMTFIKSAGVAAR
jgi:hypothetical protein